MKRFLRCLILIGLAAAFLPACPGPQVQFDAAGQVPAVDVPADSPLGPYLDLLQHPEKAWMGRARDMRVRPLTMFAADPDRGPEILARRADLTAMLKTYAPRIWWHPADPHPPMDPIAFVDNSSLWFRHDWGSDELVVPKGEVYAYELGYLNKGQYARQAHTLWWARGDAITPTSFAPMTRPFESRGIEGGDEGFYLKLEDPTLGTGIARNWWTEKLGGEKYTTPFPIGIPMFWKWGISPVRTDLGTAPAGQARIIIEYWYHLAFSHATPFYLGNHQGEWESLAVVLDVGVDAQGHLTHTPRAFFLAQHEYGQWMCPGDLKYTDASVDPERSHPEVFTALGTHATYGAEGEFDGGLTTDMTARGRAWDGWQLLRPMAIEPYFGYSGGWGEAHAVSFMSGPLVPGPTFKILPKRAPDDEAAILADARTRCGL